MTTKKNHHPDEKLFTHSGCPLTNLLTTISEIHTKFKGKEDVKIFTLPEQNLERGVSIFRYAFNCLKTPNYTN